MKLKGSKFKADKMKSFFHTLHILPVELTATGCLGSQEINKIQQDLIFTWTMRPALEWEILKDCLGAVPGLEILLL